jgi:hypothetical protein
VGVHAAPGHLTPSHPTRRPPPGEPDAAQPGDRLVRLGAVLFGIGVVAVLAVVVPFFFGVENRPLPLNVAAGGLPPLGRAHALIGVLRAARARRQR